MSVVLINEEYGGLPSLYANSGDWKDCQLKFYSRFDQQSSASAITTYNNTAGIFSLTLPASDSWENYGFAVGDQVDLISKWVYFDGAGTFSQNQLWVRTITYIAGNVMNIDASLVPVAGGGVPPIGEVANGREFPTDSIYNRFTDLLVIKQNPAKEIEFQFNLTNSGISSLISVIDGELIRFTSTDIDIMALATTANLTQVGFKSGGYVKDVILTYDTHDLTTSYRTYTLTYKVLQWGFIQDGFAEPDYFAGANDLAPIAKIILMGQSGNPNTTLETTSENLEANTGGFNENFNAGNNPNALISMTWTDHLGDPISGMDYSNPSTFVASIFAPAQSVPNSTFRFGMVYRPSDSAVYKNRVTDIARNLLVNAPEVDFMDTGAADPTTYAGFTNAEGVQFNVKDLQFVISGAGVVVSGKIIPVGAAVAYFDPIPDGTRTFSLWVSIGNYLTDGTVDSERVNLLINNDDIIDAPTLGVQIPDIVSTIMYDHGNYDAVGGDVSVDSTITTEDDVRYEAKFRLIDNIAYEGMRLKTSAFNASTGESFDLEEVLFSFAGIPEIAGQFQPNIDIPRTFNLPPTTDRNSVTLKRDATLDIAGKYGIEINYGFESLWQYWLLQANADNDFFDITEYAFDGKNQNWQRFSAHVDWKIRVAIYTQVDGVEDFDYHTFKINPYEDADLTTVVTYTKLSDGSNPMSLIDDELMEVEAALTWNDPQDYSVNSWAEATIEDFESGNRWVISSVLPHGGVVANPLEPISTAVGLDLVLVGNVATMKFIIDTNKINVNKVSISYRIFSEETLGGKQKTDGTNKQTTTGDNKLKS